MSMYSIAIICHQTLNIFYFHVVCPIRCIFNETCNDILKCVGNNFKKR